MRTISFSIASGNRTNHAVPWEAVYSVLSVPQDFFHRSKLIHIQLINPTSTNFFDLPLFMNLLILRPPSGVEEMRDLLSAMSSTSTLCKFKVTMCQRYLLLAFALETQEAGDLESRLVLLTVQASKAQLRP